jgi:tripartite-type tricarboxylate transporter receptor subunit TctC
VRGLLLLAAFFCGFAQAQWPSRAVTLIAPSTPGSAPDVLSRTLAQKLSEQLGQPVVVLNRPGAGTNVGTQALTQAVPDGYTILLGSIANTLNPHIMSKVGYRLEELAPISSVAAAPDVLVVHPSVAASSVQELIALLKAKPGTPAGHAGIGTTPHLSLEVFRRMAGVEVTPVPYKGGGEAQQGILGGQVPFMFSTTIGILPRVRSGQLRGLAVSSAKRIAAAPELPTVAESGLPGFDVVAWFGLFAPAGTPAAIVERLSAETRTALASADLRKRLVDLGAEPLGSSPAEFAAYVGAEYRRWGAFAKESGIRLD